MPEPIRILGIAPYEGMKGLMERLAPEYPGVRLTTYVGDLQKGVEIAQRSFHENYDLIISRGGTARMIQKYVPLPVVEIDISLYDILCALKLSEPFEGKVGIVGFDNITHSASLLCDLMDYKVDIFTIQAADEVEFTLRRMQHEGYQVVLCDMIANITAKRLGLNAFLITSGIGSVREAFDRAVKLYESYAQLREENHFLRNIIRGQANQTVVFDRQGELFFSSMDELDQKLLVLLRHEIPEVGEEGRWHALRSMGGMLYSLAARRLSAAGQDYVAFYISASKAPLSSNHCGIRFSFRRESEERFYGSLYSVSGATSELQDTLDRLNQSPLPIMISGEDGTGKEQVVNVLYATSPLKDHTLVTVDCALPDDKSWAFLLNHHDSPLSDAENTLYFQNVDMLPPARRAQLLSALQDMDVCRRNRVLFSCVCQKDEFITDAGAAFADPLCCLSLHLPPLRDRPERIPPLVNLYLSQLNVNLARQILGVEPEALRQLREFAWPHNYTQLKRVISELSVTAQGQTITTADVQRALKKERTTTSLAPMAEDSSAPLDLNRTLDEISRDVIRRVLEELGGNRSAAARRLGISRTTLWRLMQEE